MYEKYLIKMNDSSDWIRHWDEGTQVVNDFILPRGPHEKDEMSDTIYHKDATVPYHQHRKGYETFEIAAGSVECFMRGKRFIASAGGYHPHRALYAPRIPFSGGGYHLEGAVPGNRHVRRHLGEEYG